MLSWVIDPTYETDFSDCQSALQCSTKKDTIIVSDIGTSHTVVSNAREVIMFGECPRFKGTLRIIALNATEMSVHNADFRLVVQAPKLAKFVCTAPVVSVHSTSLREMSVCASDVEIVGSTPTNVNIYFPSDQSPRSIKVPVGDCARWTVNPDTFRFIDESDINMDEAYVRVRLSPECIMDTNSASDITITGKYFDLTFECELNNLILTESAKVGRVTVMRLAHIHKLSIKGDLGMLELVRRARQSLSAIDWPRAATAETAKLTILTGASTVLEEHVTIDIDFKPFTHLSLSLNGKFVIRSFRLREVHLTGNASVVHLYTPNMTLCNARQLKLKRNGSFILKASAHMDKIGLGAFNDATQITLGKGDDDCSIKELWSLANITCLNELYQFVTGLVYVNLVHEPYVIQSPSMLSSCSFTVDRPYYEEPVDFAVCLAGVELKLIGRFGVVTIGQSGVPKKIHVDNIEVLVIEGNAGRIGEVQSSTAPFQLISGAQACIKDVAGCAYADISAVKSSAIIEQFAAVHASVDRRNTVMLAYQLQDLNPQLVAFRNWLTGPS